MIDSMKTVTIILPAYNEESSFELLNEQMGDMQHPIDVIPEMLSYWEQGYDDVYAQRIDSKECWLKRKTSQCHRSWSRYQGL